MCSPAEFGHSFAENFFFMSFHLSDRAINKINMPKRSRSLSAQNKEKRHALLELESFLQESEDDDVREGERKKLILVFNV